MKFDHSFNLGPIATSAGGLDINGAGGGVTSGGTSLLVSAGLKISIPREFGGEGLSSVEQVEFYVSLAERDLLTAFLLTQRNAAVSWVAGSDLPQKGDFLAAALDRFLVTQAVSHIAPSSAGNNKKCPVVFDEVAGGFLVNGAAPWASGLEDAEYLVSGARALGGDEILFLVRLRGQGRSVNVNRSLLALSESDSGSVELRNLTVQRDSLLFGPQRELITQSTVGKRRGYPTLNSSALALGHARRCLNSARAVCSRQGVTTESLEELESQVAKSLKDLRKLASTGPQGSDMSVFEIVRATANALAIKASGVNLLCHGGSGFVSGAEPERLVRESYFFLVWGLSLAAKNLTLTQLAGLSV